MLPGFQPLGREEISLSGSADLVRYLKEIAALNRS